MSVEIAPSDLPPLALLQDKREAKYTQDPALAELLAYQEAPLRNEAAEKKASSEMLGAEPRFAEIARRDAKAAVGLVKSAKTQSTASETAYEASQVATISRWNAALAAADYGGHPVELTIPEKLDPVQSKVSMLRARETFLHTFRAGEPVIPPDGVVWKSGLPTGHEGKGEMTVLGIIPLPKELGKKEIVVGVPDTVLARAKGAIKPEQTIWAVRRVKKMPSGKPPPGVGGN